MGYRSDVVIALTREQWLKEKLRDRIPPEFNKLFQLEKEETAYLLWATYDIKWYPDYHSVKKISDWIDQIAEETDTDFAFMALGEEFGDLSAMGDPSAFDIYAHQHLQY